MTLHHILMTVLKNLERNWQALKKNLTSLFPLQLTHTSVKSNLYTFWFYELILVVIYKGHKHILFLTFSNNKYFYHLFRLIYGK